MTRIKIAAGLATALGLAALTAHGAEGAAAERAKAREADRAAEARSNPFTWGRHEQDGAPKSSRLRFRSADGTCSCTCARGGITEEEIRKAEQARERARS
jgi:hypothetical protein